MFENLPYASSSNQMKIIMFIQFYVLPKVKRLTRLILNPKTRQIIINIIALYVVFGPGLGSLLMFLSGKIYQAAFLFGIVIMIILIGKNVLMKIELWANQ